MLEIKAGKTYVTRIGDVVGPVELVNTTSAFKVRYHDGLSAMRWTTDGKAASKGDHPNDIIGEPQGTTAKSATGLSKGIEDKTVPNDLPTAGLSESLPPKTIRPRTKKGRARLARQRFVTKLRRGRQTLGLGFKAVRGWSQRLLRSARGVIQKLASLFKKHNISYLNYVLGQHTGTAALLSVEKVKLKCGLTVGPSQKLNSVLVSGRNLDAHSLHYFLQLAGTRPVRFSDGRAYVMFYDGRKTVLLGRVLSREDVLLLKQVVTSGLSGKK